MIFLIISTLLFVFFNSLNRLVENFCLGNYIKWGIVTKVVYTVINYRKLLSLTTVLYALFKVQN
jgi:cytochrome c oxidase subunit IV